MKAVFNIKERPYVLLLFTAIALFLTMAFATAAADSEHRDLELFSMPVAVMGWIIPVFLTSVGLIYLLTAGFLFSNTFTWIHIIISLTTSILIVILFFTGVNQDKAVSVDRQEFMGKAMQILFFAFVCGQIIFVINVLSGFSKKWLR